LVLGHLGEGFGDAGGKRSRSLFFQ